jgi:hypothetical protein
VRVLVKGSRMNRLERVVDAIAPPPAAATGQASATRTH